MPLFSKKKKKEIETEEVKKEAPLRVSTFVIEPHIAEKATALSEKGVYVFKIDKKINKVMVRQAVKEKYNVVPRKVNIINLPHKPTTFRGRKSQKGGFKKAMVYLKAGDKIELS
jgi:large subunit ribosomal protein L23